MAREPRRNQKPIDDDPPVERIVRPVPFDPAEESFSNFRQKFGSDGVMVKIYRRTSNGNHFCFQDTPAAIDEEAIRIFHAKQPYAAEVGNYFAKPFVNGEPRDASIEILIAPQVGMPIPSNENGGMAHQNGGGGRIEAALDRILDRLDRVERGDREPMSQIADAMLKIQSMMPKQESSIDNVIKAIELGKSLNIPPGEVDEWKPLIKELLVGAAPLLQGLAVKFFAGQPARPGAQGVVPVNDNQRLFAAIQYLKAKCNKGSHPGLYVDMVLDSRDEPDNQKLLHTITTEEFSSFVAIDPEIGQPPYLPWFKFLYDGLRSGVTEFNTVETDTIGESGNKGDIKGDGKAGKGGDKKR